MTKAKEITGELYFSDHEPRIIGHLEIGGEHFEIVGLKRTAVRTDLTGRRIKPEQQEDLFNDEQEHE